MSTTITPEQPQQLPIAMAFLRDAHQLAEKIYLNPPEPYEYDNLRELNRVLRAIERWRKDEVVSQLPHSGRYCHFNQDEMLKLIAKNGRRITAQELLQTSDDVRSMYQADKILRELDYRGFGGYDVRKQKSTGRPALEFVMKPSLKVAIPFGK